MPDGVFAAPGRVNLIGEHTDYCDGFVLPFALPHRTVVTATRADRPEWTVTSRGETVRFDLSEPVRGWAAYVAGVVWALRDAGFSPPGAVLALESTVPLGAGLSSSAALECAVLTALVELGGLDLPVPQRPALAQRAENVYVGVPCGIMDQSASTLARAGHALFLDCRSQAVEHIPFDVAGHGLAVLVIDTRSPHELTDGEYAARRAACELAAQTLGIRALRDATLEDLSRLDGVPLRRARHVVTENQRVVDTVALLHAGKVREIGPLLSASHESLRHDFEVTVPRLDIAVEAALDAGAYGARMTGGGFGGCVLALVDAGAVSTVDGSVREAFARNGFGAPESFTAVPSQGAARIG
jgi:galactokinase